MQVSVFLMNHKLIIILVIILLSLNKQLLTIANGPIIWVTYRPLSLLIFHLYDLLLHLFLFLNQSLIKCQFITATIRTDIYEIFLTLHIAIIPIQSSS